MVCDLRLRTATPEDLDWIHGLRHRVYAQELGQHAPDPSGRLRDGLEKYLPRDDLPLLADDDNMYRAAGLRPVGRTIHSGAVTFEVLTGGVAELTKLASERYGSTLERLRSTVDWQLDVPFAPRPDGCEHGGASFTAIGTDFRTLHRRHEIVAADVLDAWFAPAPGVRTALAEDPAWAARTAAFRWGRPGAVAVAVTAGVIAVTEYGGLVRMGRPDRGVLAAAVVGVDLAAWLAPGEVFRVAAAGALAVASVPLPAGDADHGLRRLGTGLLGLAWLGVTAALVPLGASALVVFVAVSIADIVASFAGPALGGPRLSPLSPARRWSGTLAGAAAGLGALAVLSALSLPMAVAVVIGGPAGGLLESMIKRGAQAKGSGHWPAGVHRTST